MRRHCLVVLAVPGRGDQNLDGLTEQIPGHMPENSLRRRICRLNQPQGIDGDDGVVGGFQDGPHPLLPFQQRMVGPFQRPRLAVQLDEHRHLRPQNLRNHRDAHVIDCTDLVAADAIEIRGVDGSDEDDRRLGEARMFANQGGGLEAVHAWHVDVQQNDGNLFLQQDFEGLISRPGAQQILAKPRQHRLVSEQLLRLIVHQKYVERVGRYHSHVLSLYRFGLAMCETGTRQATHLCNQTRISDSS